ncbi:MAG: LLM class flavin-dependent oxidoreductase [Silicimonas sp.]|nr:LLM class flavin-dependent oxidoreductase [Silicimonas sp.]
MATFKKHRPASGAFIDFTKPTSEIVRLVLALDHGGYRNPLAVPKLAIGDKVYLVRKASPAHGDGSPGTILSKDASGVCVTTRDGAVQLGALSDLTGCPIDPKAIKGNSVAPLPAADTLDNAMAEVIRGESYWTRQFEMYRPAHWLAPGASDEFREWSREISLPSGFEARAAFAGFAAIVSGLCAFQSVDLALGQPQVLHGVTATWVPVRFDASKPWKDAAAGFAETLDSAGNMGMAAADLMARCPDIEHRIMPDAALSYGGPVAGAALTFAITGQTATIYADLSRITVEEADLITDRTRHLLENIAPDTNAPIAALPMLPSSERDLVLTAWNETAVKVDRDTCIHQHFEARAAQVPDKVALVFEDTEITYGALDARANQIAQVLKDMGVGPGKPVGLYLRRSLDLVTAALGILKAGGAYLPLDPNYPADRLALFVQDSGADVIVTEAALDGQFTGQSVTSLLVNDPRIEAAPTTECGAAVTANDLAYLIYTSGSTGTPKGVMIPHRTVSNFFTGMDARIKHDPPGVLMAVTSLSFDISVLELFWTLARGFKVVISGEEKLIAESGSAPASAMDFSLFYWGNDDGVGRDKYALLLEGAQFADQNGFTAIWTPERHFHAFGGLYPNPSVTGAAVAAVTRNIAIRAGSCVAPLHHPARIAEEWAVIDNLTDGKTGIAIASGWQPDDFVLRPENTPPENKPAMTRAINDLRKLWAGEKVAFPKADGTLHEVMTQPRPVSKELPIWVTTAGNPDTWRQAGEMGANVLTHLLGQSIDEVGEKIEIYHAALRGAGHDPRDFAVTLMLHTFIAQDRETAKSIAREPMKNYLRAAADLIKQYAWAFPAFKRPKGVDTARQLDLGGLEPDELETILDFAFERYFEDSGLFGTVDDALARVEQVSAIGVTEIACLIDYGIERQVVLDGLRPLADVVRRAAVRAPGDDWSIAAQIERHKATHLQCTPYMARMLVTNEASRNALGSLKHMMVGGEALSGSLVADLNTATDASIENMYGPTETTIWSTTERAEAGPGTVCIGRPIANTQVYVLNDAMEPCPVGVAGELYIGGDGVALGYWKRDDLTAERFLDDPFRDGNKMFKTGDLAKWRADGKLDFLGRNDGQVKIRGYRMELGEIEAALEAEIGVTQAAVVVRPDASGVGVLTAYITGDAAEAALRASLAKRLPPFMVPTRIHSIDAMPLTPNKKIDRKALKPPVAVAAKPVAPAKKPKASAPQTSGAQVDVSDIETTIAEVWARILGVEKVTSADNFFDLGGHSLLAVEAHREIKKTLGISTLSIADIFRAPTLSGLTARAKSLVTHDASSTEVTKAAETPAEVIDKRRAMRQRRLTQ